MATVISEFLDHDPIVGFVGIVDAEAEESPDDAAVDPGEWAATGPNWIAVDESSDTGCLIKYELWDGEPPSSPSWDATWQGTVHLESGDIRPEDLHGTDLTAIRFDLGRPGRKWNIRIHRVRPGHEEFTPDVIRLTLLKFQFWL
jgi:hypothetical protein